MKTIAMVKLLREALNGASFPEEPKCSTMRLVLLPIRRCD